MRISTGMMAQSAIANVQTAFERIARSQEQMGTGRRINRPSDDPVSLQHMMTLKNAIQRTEQFRRNAEETRNFLGVTDSALDEAMRLVRRARTLAVQAANDTIDASVRANLANEVRGAILQLGAIGNTAYGNRHVFAGQRTLAPPFEPAAGGGFEYVGGRSTTGDADLIAQIGPSDMMVINTTGDLVFGSAFAALHGLRANLEGGSSSLISREDLPAFDEALTTLMGVRVQVGSSVRRLENVVQRYESATLNYTQIVSRIEDADIARTAVDLQTAELTYQGALAATRIGFQQSLLDFLR